MLEPYLKRLEDKGIEVVKAETPVIAHNGQTYEMFQRKSDEKLYDDALKFMVGTITNVDTLEKENLTEQVVSSKLDDIFDYLEETINGNIIIFYCVSFRVAFDVEKQKFFLYYFIRGYWK